MTSKFDIPFDLSSDWGIFSVEQLIDQGLIEKPLDGNHGGIHPKASDYIDYGVPFIMASDLKNGRVSFSSCKFISNEQAGKLRKGFAKAGDVLLSHKATIGRTAIVQENEHSFIVLTPQVTYYRIKDSNKLNGQYLKSYFDSRFFQNILGQWAGAGSTRAYLGITGQLKLPIIVPPISTQKSIALIVGALDDKIELNRQTNQTLEEMSQAIFKSWFVDFEPVKAKIEAKQNSQNPERAAIRAISGKTNEELSQLPSDQLAQLTTTAAIFPDEMVESKLGIIPSGWVETNLSAITSELRRGVSPKYIEEGGVQVVNQKCIRNHTVNFSLCRRNDPMKRKIDGRELHVGDILVNSTGVGTLGRLAPIRYLPETTVADSHVTVVRGKKEKVTTSFLTSVMLTKESFIESSGAGSTGQTELRRQALEEIGVCIPSYNIQEAFEKVVKPTHDHIAQNEQQQFSLTQLRDTLLPKLLSGEISVADTQAKIEEAV